MAGLRKRVLLEQPVVEAVATFKSQLWTSLLTRNPCREFLEIGRIHLADQFKTMLAMDRQNMSRLKQNLVTEMHLMQSGLGQMIVNDSR